MALGDGAVWNEALPDNDTVAHTIDDHNRDLRVGVSARMRREHIWPDSQTGTAEAGHHNFVTLQFQAAAPTIAGTTGGALWIETSSCALYYTDSAGNDLLLANSALGLPIISGGTQGSIAICSSAAAHTVIPLTASASLLYLRTNTNTGAPTWSNPITDHFAVASGVVNHGTTIGSIAGFASAGCTVFVSLNNSTSAQGTANPDGIAYKVSVDANRAVTAVWTSINAAGGSGTCAVNYLVVGTK